MLQSPASGATPGAAATAASQSAAKASLEGLTRAVFDSSADGLVAVDSAGSVLLANPAAATIFGYAPDEIAGRPFHLLVPVFKTRPLTRRLHATGAAAQEAEGRHASGHGIPIELSVTAAGASEQSVTTIVVRDITERKAHEDQLRQMALYDPLTGLPNRSLLHDRIKTAIHAAKRQNQRVGLLLLDLDRFKEINDTLGHQIGDLVLQNVAERLVAPLRRSDTVARLGGDEFAILLPNVVSLEQLEQLCKRCLAALDQPYEIEDLSLHVGGSIGMALYPDHAEDVTRLMQCADVAMYMAKKNDLSFSWYDAEKDHYSVRHLTLSGDLRRALDGNQMMLHYQPQIDLKTRSVCGVEALSRWTHPTEGFIPPDEFIGLAERTGLIPRLTRWVVETAFKQLALWQGKGFDLNVSINLSARNIQEASFAHDIADMIARWRIDPRFVIFELTESTIMSDPERAFEAMNRLSALGVRFSIDDFGTGYSSLSYLKRLPVSELKIDKSFVLHIDRQANDAEIVRATIDLGHNLGLRVVAEGVEGAPHLAELLDAGCDIGQGYYFARPMPVGDLERWLAEAPHQLAPQLSPERGAGGAQALPAG